MLERDLDTFAHLGRALWADPGKSDPTAVDTLSAVRLMNLTEEKAIERAAQALLDRALKQGMAANTHSNFRVPGVNGNPFFRLFPTERFLLVALHQGRWSYARLARVLKESPERVEELAWSARIALAGSALVPTGARRSTASCPEYDSQHPWTQRFLDEEIHSTQRVFLQNHLMACDSCRASLSRCRDLYYAVEGRLPKLVAHEDFVENLERVFRRSRWLKTPLERSFGDTLAIFLARRENLLVLAVFGAIIAFLIYRAFSTFAAGA